ncbi:related to ER membrane protein complex subunit 3 [Zygosaccharomyces bailii ISA1307]|nr:related to ER membrane protein complex subunit 3 [Zygosaccharomyces bailii ISA1307]
MALSLLSMIATGSAGAVAELTLDPKLKYWVLLPISVVMVLTGILRQYIMDLIAPSPKGVPRVKLTESQWIYKAQALLGNGSQLSEEAFQAKKEFLTETLADAKYLVKMNTEGDVANPLSDPNFSESMFSMAKGNLANFIPQTIIMWWVNHFFAGFVLMKLPFPLTPRFKEMLQSGVMTADLDVRWVSSISWYFISVLGLNPVYNLILSTSANGDFGVQQPPVMGGAPGEPQPEAVMKSLANDLTIAQHESCFGNIEERVLAKYT